MPLPPRPPPKEPTTGELLAEFQGFRDEMRRALERSRSNIREANDSQADMRSDFVAVVNHVDRRLNAVLEAVTTKMDENRDEGRKAAALRESRAAEEREHQKKAKIGWVTLATAACGVFQILIEVLFRH